MRDLQLISCGFTDALGAVRLCSSAPKWLKAFRGCFLRLQEGGGVLQCPIDIAAEVEAATFDVKLDILLGSSQIGASDASGAGPVIYAGDHQVNLAASAVGTNFRRGALRRCAVWRGR